MSTNPIWPSTTESMLRQTHDHHWNIASPMFQTLHLMFESQYNELALAVDLIAERIRAVGASVDRLCSSSGLTSPDVASRLRQYPIGYILNLIESRKGELR